MRAKADALEQVHKLGTAAGAAMLALQAGHATLSKSRFYNPPLTRPEETEKAEMVAGYLEGLRASQDDSQSWDKGPLRSTIWHAALIAIKSVRDPELFRKWEESGKRDVEAFLRDGKWIGSPSDSPERAKIHLEVDCPADVSVSTPFILGQILICLIQNAIRRPEGADYRPVVTIRYCDPGLSNQLSVANRPRRLSSQLVELINESRDLGEFEQCVYKLLASGDQNRPGLGLVHAYCTALLFYGGLKVQVSPEGTTFTVALTH